MRLSVFCVAIWLYTGQCLAAGFVQGAIGALVAGPTNTVGATFASTVGVGNIVAGGVAWSSGTASVSTIKDDQNNSLAILHTSAAFSGNNFYTIFAETNVRNAPITVTVTFSDSTVGVIQVGMIEAKGFGAVDQSLIGPDQSLPGTGANAITSGNVTPTKSGEYIVGLSVNTSGEITVVAGSNFIMRKQDTVGTNWGFSIEDLVLAGAAATAATFTTPTNNADYVTGIITFLPAGCGQRALLGVGC